MGSLDEASKAHRRNIETRTGRPFDDLVTLARESGLQKHGQVLKMLKTDLGMGHGDANHVAHVALASDEPGPADPADGWYSGKKASQRPLHDHILAIIVGFGGDIEHAPKKTYLSLRRKRQFATLGPAAKGTVEIGINLKGAEGDDRMAALGPGKMCTHRARLSSEDQVDEAVIAWLRKAWTAAG
jgi:hypothetical protein